MTRFANIQRAISRPKLAILSEALMEIHAGGSFKSIFVPNEHTMATWLADQLRSSFKKFYNDEIQKATGQKWTYDVSSSGGSDGAAANIGIQSKDYRFVLTFGFQEVEGGALLKHIKMLGDGMSDTEVAGIHDVINHMLTVMKQA